jgi:rare lipoprotein A
LHLPAFKPAYFYADIQNMKKNYLFLFVLFVTVFIPYHLQAQDAETFRQEGIASWYGKEFDGRPTASGEIYDSSKLTAAHPNLPFGTMLVITNQHNNKKVTVRVNDRGPFVAARIIDVSRAAADQLDMIVTGTAPVLVESIDRIAVSNKSEEPVKPSQTAGEIKIVYVNEATQTPVSNQSAVVQTPAPSQIPVTTATAPSNIPVVYVQQPAAYQVNNQIKLTPEISIAHNKKYRLQIGSYRVAKNAVDTFERLKTAGLNPAYERHEDSVKGEFFRVVLAGISGVDVQSTAEKLGVSGFREALIREEN